MTFRRGETTPKKSVQQVKEVLVFVLDTSKGVVFGSQTNVRGLIGGSFPILSRVQANRQD